MITGEGLISKIVTTIISKSATKLASLAVDKRRKACRTLAKLYYALIALDEATNQFLQTFGAFRRTSDVEAFVSTLRSHAHLWEVPSNAFIDLSRELEPGLQIIDPALARCLHFLYSSKGDFLSFLSCSIEFRHEQGVERLFIYRPNKKILATDFENAYQESLGAYKRGETYYWPSGAFDYFHDFEELDVTVAEERAITELIDMIREHNRLLKQAREALRKLLAENFSIEEILFQPETWRAQ